MKLITYESDGRQRVGVLRGAGEEMIVDLAAGVRHIGREQDAPHMSSMLTLIEGGAAALELAREVLATAEKGGSVWGDVPAGSVRWKAPLPVPPQLRDCMMFEEHLQNSYKRLRHTLAEQSKDPVATLKDFEERGVYRIPQVWYDLPLYYKVNRFSFIGPGDDIIWPPYTEKLDFELEYACVLGRTTKDVSAADAAQHIFGYTIFNDVSARDVQSIEMQGQLGPQKGKDFDTGNILGPCIVTADAVNTENMTMIARVNGEQWCKGNSGSAYWKFPKVIEFMSRSETLMPGEMIGSGTVGGGCGLERGEFLKPGDVIELEVEGIGTLRNRVVRK